MHFNLAAANSKVGVVLFYCLSFLIAFVSIPLYQLDFLQLVPGNIGDGRLNAYFLEHIWQVIIGRSESFVHPPFFSPNLWVVAFSDNHWGTAAAYIVWRGFGFDPITSFQLWWLTSYVANFAAAVVSLRVLRLSPFAATVGALVFTFALPVAAHSYGHAQLSYRFGAPLAVAFFIRFLLDGGIRNLLIVAIFVVWQTYATIYIGFFTLISLLFVALAHLRFFCVSRTQLLQLLAPASSSMKSIRISHAALFLFLFALFVGAFVPYLIPRGIYGSNRGIDEIWTMLPRVASYFYTDTSSLWTMSGGAFELIPMRHEHQMFIGISALIMVIWGARRAKYHVDCEAARLLWITLVSLVLITLSADGVSIWTLFAQLPLASAIRAMTRIDLIMLFFAGALVAVLVDQAAQRGWPLKGALCVGLAGLALEAHQIRPITTEVNYVENILARDVATVGTSLPEDSLLFFSQRNNQDVLGAMPFYAMEVRAMWAGLTLGIPVLNGYSGKFPPNARPVFDNDCSEAGSRLASAYKVWPELETELGPLNDTLEKVHLIGFAHDCGLEEVKNAAELVR